jgi:hypothetical protein
MRRRGKRYLQQEREIENSKQSGKELLVQG